MKLWYIINYPTRCCSSKECREETRVIAISKSKKKIIEFAKNLDIPFSCKTIKVSKANYNAVQIVVSSNPEEPSMAEIKFVGECFEKVENWWYDHMEEYMDLDGYDDHELLPTIKDYISYINETDIDFQLQICTLELL